jgi:hypothetical protein
MIEPGAWCSIQLQAAGIHALDNVENVREVPTRRLI